MVDVYKRQGYDQMYWAMLLNLLVYMPTLSLANTVSYNALEQYKSASGYYECGKTGSGRSSSGYFHQSAALSEAVKRCGEDGRVALEHYQKRSESSLASGHDKKAGMMSGF